MPSNEKKKQYDKQYRREKLHRIPLTVQNAKYDEIKAAADRAHESVAGYIRKATDLRIESEKSDETEK